MTRQQKSKATIQPYEWIAIGSLFAVSTCALLAIILIVILKDKKTQTTVRNQNPPTAVAKSPNWLNPKTPEKSEPVVKLMNRKEFTDKVFGKTPNEVLEAVGKPFDTNGSENDQVWTYYDRTTDPITGKTDGVAVVWFEDGRVVRVGF